MLTCAGCANRISDLGGSKGGGFGLIVDDDGGGAQKKSFQFWGRERKYLVERERE